MTTSNHQIALKAKHATLEAAIEDELQRPKPNDVLIAKWKKQKLSIKEQLSTY